MHEQVTVHCWKKRMATVHITTTERMAGLQCHVVKNKKNVTVQQMNSSIRDPRFRSARLNHSRVIRKSISLNL